MNRECRICKKSEFKEVIDFGQNALVNSLIEKEDLDKKEPTFPLVVEQCQNCFLVQIVNPIDSHKIYRDADYLYFSGDMPNLKQYFYQYAKEDLEKFLMRGDFVVEIGSNDGTMLEFFNSAYRILGVDPASNTVIRALKNWIPTLSDGFCLRIAKSIKREFGEAKLIYGNNCIAHIDDLHNVLKGVKELLSSEGIFVVECNYWGGMVKNKNYSLIYHDHFSYFSLKNWEDMAKMYGMEVFDAWVTPAQGGSLRVFLAKNKQLKTKRYHLLHNEEDSANLNSYETCEKYKKDVLEEAFKLGSVVRDLKDKNKTIAGYGAAAKGFSILKLADIDERHIDYFVDDSPAKQGKYTPVSHIPVISRQEAESKLPDYFFITAPNYKNVIMEKEKRFREKGGKFILDTGEIKGIQTF